MKPFLAMKKAIWGGAVLVAIVALALYIWMTRNKPAEDVLRISGNVEVTEVQVSFKVPGRVKSRLVEEGALVNRGEVVARLEDDELRDALAKAEADEQAARATLSELEAGSRREEIAQGEALLAAARAEALRLETDYKRTAALYAKEVVPKRELDAARAARDAQQASVREKKEALQLLRKGPRKERIDEARARLQAARALASDARQRLGYATLISPLSGVVLTKGVEPGEQVSAGTPVITVGDMGQTWLRGYIPETELGRVKLGQRANVHTDSYPGKVFPGTISFISSEAEFTPKSVQTEKERVKLVYRIKITLDNPRMELKPGMPADADILLKAP